MPSCLKRGKVVMLDITHFLPHASAHLALKCTSISFRIACESLLRLACATPLPMLERVTLVSAAALLITGHKSAQVGMHVTMTQLVSDNNFCLLQLVSISWLVGGRSFCRIHAKGYFCSGISCTEPCRVWILLSHRSITVETAMFYISQQTQDSHVSHVGPYQCCMATSCMPLL